MSEDEEYSQVVKEYYRIYRPLQKKYNLRDHHHFSIYSDGLIEIWEYKGDERKRLICKVTEETDIQCFKRAIEELKNYEKEKEKKTYEQKAG